MEKVDSTSDDRTANNTVRHQYRALHNVEKAAMQTIKDIGLEFSEAIDRLQRTSFETDHGAKRCVAEASGRELALAKTKIEEAVMWAVKGITA